jgi:tripeptidyl-peptidase-1
MLFIPSLSSLSIYAWLIVPILAVVHEQLVALPAGWTQTSAAAGSDAIVLSIGLQQQNLDKLESSIYSVSTPDSDSYGQYMEGADVAALIAPSSDSESAVVSWLQSAGVTQINSDGEWVDFVTSVETANTLLGTEFSYFTNEGVTKLRTTEYSIPSDLVQHIDLVTPTTYFGRTVAHAPVAYYPVKSLGKRQAVAATCSQLITPACLKELYHVDGYVPSVSSGSKIGFGSFLNQSARYADLAIYEKVNSIPAQNFSVTLINGGVNDQALDGNHGEADLDVQNIIGVSHPLPVISYITGGSPPFIPNLDEPLPADNSNEPYLPYYRYLLAQPNSALPQVITNSYGDDEQTVPIKYATRVCNMIGQMGLRGISILESAGDTGVGAPCQSNDGKATPQFTPQFPGTCPYVTAVGGTQSISPEVAWVDGSGGFSNYFTQPYYQASAVNTYLTKYISPATKAYYEPYTNFTSRGFPDVSAHSLTPK